MNAFIISWPSSSLTLHIVALSQTAEVVFGKKNLSPPKLDDYESSKHSELPSHADPETNVYNYGILLLEIISGRLPYSKEHGYLLDWVKFLILPPISLHLEISFLVIIE